MGIMISYLPSDCYVYRTTLEPTEKRVNGTQLSQNVVLNFWLEFPKNDLIINLLNLRDKHAQSKVTKITELLNLFMLVN